MTATKGHLNEYYNDPNAKFRKDSAISQILEPHSKYILYFANALGQMTREILHKQYPSRTQNIPNHKSSTTQADEGGGSQIYP
jgi:hypothetical protein